MSSSSSWKNDLDPLLESHLFGRQRVDRDPDEPASSSSFSGKERNHLFLNDGNGGFADISGLSGLDAIGDTRAIALIDYDRDGWQDIGLVNANAPLLQLFRNNIGAVSSETRNVVAVRFVGGNHTDQPAEGLSCRDAFGALLWVDLGDGKQQLREHRCGEGFASQNSATMLIGLGARASVSTLRVRFSSGKEHVAKSVSAGQLVTFYEVPEQSPNGRAFTLEPYIRKLARPAVRADQTEASALLLASAEEARSPGERGQLRMYTTMATWCASCKRELPQLAYLRQRFSPSVLEMFGLPVDPNDDPEELKSYSADNEPVYTLVTSLTTKERLAIDVVLSQWLKGEALPSTVITDAHGVVLGAFRGVPTASDVARIVTQAAEPPG